MLYWRFHFKNEILVNYLSTHWKWTYIYYILDLEGEVHSIWDMWRSGLQECEGNDFFEVGWGGQSFPVGSKKSQLFVGQLPLPVSTSPKKLVGGKILSALQNRSLEQSHWSCIWICILRIMKTEPPHPWCRCKCTHGLNSYCIPCTSLTSHRHWHIATFKCFFY